MGEPLCPSCGRYAQVWPSTRIVGVGHETINAICAEFEFHGFTFGEHGTVSQLFDVLEDFAKRLPGHVG